MKMTTFLLSILMGLSATTAMGQKQIPLAQCLGKSSVMKLSEVAKSVRYVPLETTDESLIGSHDCQVHVTADCIFVSDLKGRFLRFDRDGRFLNAIGRQGEGPAEFVRALFFTVDESRKEVYLADTFGEAVKVYAYDGTFLRRIPMPAPAWKVGLLGDRLVLPHSNYYRRQKDGSLPPELFITDPEGRQLKRMKSSVPATARYVRLLNMPSLYSLGGSVYYKNITNAYIYKVDEKLGFSNAYKILMGGEQNESEDQYADALKGQIEGIIIRDVQEGEKHLMLLYTRNDEAQCYWYDKATGRGRNIAFGQAAGFQDDLKLGTVFTPTVQSSSTEGRLLVTLIPAEEYSKRDPSTRLADDDNPVIGIATLK